MPQSPSPQNAALVAHIAQQTRQNLDFLVAQNYISASEASTVSRSLGRLTSDRGVLNSNSNEGDFLTDRAQNLLLNDRPPSRTQAARRSVPPPQRPTPVYPNQARAIWDHTGDEPGDLSFRAGDSIDIISEDNPDWWTGRVSGTTREGLIPANYLEKISSPSNNVRASSPNPNRNSFAGFPNSSPSFPSSSPAGNPPRYAPPAGPPPPQQGPWQPPPPHWQTPPPQSYYSPPPSGPMMNDKPGMYAPSPMAPVVQAPFQPPPPAPQEPKKSKFSGLGSTLATSAAGGLGFGAGAAVGGDLINSIF